MIIGIDGCRPDALIAARTPNLDALVQDGAVSYQAQTCENTVPLRHLHSVATFPGVAPYPSYHPPPPLNFFYRIAQLLYGFALCGFHLIFGLDAYVTVTLALCIGAVSAPGWSSMLTGVWPTKHGVTDNSFAGSRFDHYPHFFCRLKEACNEVFTASFVNWEPIHSNIVTQADLSTSYATDAEVAQAASEFVTEYEPDVLFLHFDEVDQAGHAYGFGPNVPGYLDALRLLDGRIEVVLTALRGRKSYDEEDWLILISTDHGGSGRGHGENVPEHRTIFLVVSGPATARGEIEPPPLVVDIPPTVFTHLGLSIDPAWSWDGHPVDYQL